MARELAQFVQLRVPKRPTLESFQDVERYMDALIVGLSDYSRGLVNALARYSTGTWTPIDGSGAGLGFTGESGTWVKIGELVIATCVLVYPANGSGANAVVGGLPYPIGAFYSPAICYITPDPITTLAFGVANTTGVALVASSGGAARLNNTLGGDTIAFTLVYETT